VLWLWGGFSVANPTPNKFFSYIFYFPSYPGTSGIHLLLLISQDPLTQWYKLHIDKTTFTPYYTIKDFLVYLFFLCIHFNCLLYADALGHPDNYIPANPDITPPISFLNGISTVSRHSQSYSDKAFGVVAY